MRGHSFPNQTKKMEQKEDIILVIDDDRASRRMLARALSEAGYACRESARVGRRRWQCCRRKFRRFSCSIFTCRELNGAEVLSRLRAQMRTRPSRKLPAIMLTGDGGEESEVRCLEAGANDFVTKPINLPVLRARIETQLRLRIAPPAVAAAKR